MAKRGWSKPLSGFATQASDDLTVMFKDAGEQAARDIIYGSPKDTSRFLSNHNFSVNNPDESYDPNKRDLSRSEALANARAAMAALKAGDTFHIVNTTPYGEVLESGSSTQAPQGIYSVAANNLREASR